jgi:hypothetical protein
MNVRTKVPRLILPGSSQTTKNPPGSSLSAGFTSFSYEQGDSTCTFLISAECWVALIEIMVIMLNHRYGHPIWLLSEFSGHSVTGSRLGWLTGRLCYDKPAETRHARMP